MLYTSPGNSATTCCVPVLATIQQELRRIREAKVERERGVGVRERRVGVGAGRGGEVEA